MRFEIHVAIEDPASVVLKVRPLDGLDGTIIKNPVIYVPIRLYICRERSTNHPFLCKTNPILSAVGGLQMNVNSLITKDYRKNDDFAVQKNKPNSNPIKANTKPIKANTKPIQSQYKPNQSQFQTRSEFTPKGAEIPTGGLLGILKPGTNFKRGRQSQSIILFSPARTDCRSSIGRPITFVKLPSIFSINSSPPSCMA